MSIMSNHCLANRIELLEIYNNKVLIAKIDDSHINITKHFNFTAGLPIIDCKNKLSAKIIPNDTHGITLTRIKSPLTIDSAGMIIQCADGLIVVGNVVNVH